MTEELNARTARMIDISKKINYNHDDRKSEPAGDKRSSGHQMDVRAEDAA